MSIEDLFRRVNDDRWSVGEAGESLELKEHWVFGVPYTEATAELSYDPSTDSSVETCGTMYVIESTRSIKARRRLSDFCQRAISAPGDTESACSVQVVIESAGHCHEAREHVMTSGEFHLRTQLEHDEERVIDTSLSGSRVLHRFRSVVCA